MAKINKYDIKKTLKKVGITTAILLVSGLIVWWQNDVKYMSLVPVLVGILDWLQHRN